MDRIFAGGAPRPWPLTLIVYVLEKTWIAKDMAPTFDCSRRHDQVASFHADWALRLDRGLDLYDVIPFYLCAGVFQVLLILHLCLSLPLWVNRIEDKSERCLGRKLWYSCEIPRLPPISTHTAPMPRHWTLGMVWFWLLSLEGEPGIGIVGLKRPSPALLVLLLLAMGRSLSYFHLLLFRI